MIDLYANSLGTVHIHRTMNVVALQSCFKAMTLRKWLPLTPSAAANFTGFQPTNNDVATKSHSSTNSVEVISQDDEDHESDNGVEDAAMVE